MGAGDQKSHTKNSILGEVIGILKGINPEWEMGFGGGIGPDSYLMADLAFKSINIIQFVEAAEKCFGRTDLPYQKFLQPEGGIVNDWQVSELVEFLFKHLNDD